MKHIMVDFETTGLRPDRNSMIQLAAVPFDPDTRTVDHDNMFNRCLQQLDNRPPDYDCIVNFWGRNREHFNKIVSLSEPAETVLVDFVRWVGYDGAILWAKPSHFEHPWLESYFADFKIPNPFHYRNSMDLYSFIRGLFGLYHTDDLPSEIMDLKLEGVAHDAIFDCLHQISMLFVALDMKHASS